jgi:hypothetical protein
VALQTGRGNGDVCEPTFAAAQFGCFTWGICMQRIREAAPKLEAMGDAALMAQALERRTQTRTAIIDDILAKWITNLQVTRLDVLPEGSVPLSEHFQALFDWFQNILDGNRYFVQQWKVFPAEWKV